MKKAFENRVITDAVDEEKVYRCRRNIYCHNTVFQEGILVNIAKGNKHYLCIAEFGAMCDAMLDCSDAVFDMSVVEDGVDKWCVDGLSYTAFADFFEEATDINRTWAEFRSKDCRQVSVSLMLLLIAVISVVFLVSIVFCSLSCFLISCVLTLIQLGLCVYERANSAAMFNRRRSFIEKYARVITESEAE